MRLQKAILMLILYRYLSDTNAVSDLQALTDLSVQSWFVLVWYGMQDLFFEPPVIQSKYWQLVSIPSY